MVMELRPYQAEAIDACWQGIRQNPGNPCIVLPTGAGKTPVLASMCREACERWGGRVLILSHVKELLEQSRDTLADWYPGCDVGLYSAGLKSRDTDNRIVVASIQSCHNKSYLFGERHLIIVDEAHLIPPKGQGRYQTLMQDQSQHNPKARVIGLTATPYRTDVGELCGDDSILNYVAYKAEIADLIEQGYLCPVVNSSTGTHADLTGVSIRGGEFVQSQMEQAFQNNTLIQQAVKETIELTAQRQSILVFAAGVAHGEQVRAEFDRVMGEGHAEFLCGDTPLLERDRIIRAFKDGRLRVLINVNVLTTGFDAKSVDAVVVLRATCSPGLFYQIVGRGFRLHPGKSDCLVLDYGQNIERHGALDSPTYGRKKRGGGQEGDGEAPTKTCPECSEEVPLNAMQCPYCEYEFPEGERHGSEADQEAALLNGSAKPQVSEPVWLPVESIDMVVHTKKNAREGDPRTMRVDYYIGEGAMADKYSEWVCVEHPEKGFPRRRAEQWWRERSEAPFASNAEEAVIWWKSNGFADVPRICVQKDGQYWRIIAHEIGDIPTPEQWIIPEETEGLFEEAF